MNKRNYKTPLLTLLRVTVSSLMIFVLTLSIVLTGLARAGKSVERDGIKSAEDEIHRAAVSCYALEGAYPESFEYLKTHYELKVNENLYAVHYNVFASNIMPEITVIKLQGLGYEKN